MFSKRKKYQYMVLKVIDWGEEVNFEDIERWTGLYPTKINSALSYLLHYDYIGKKKEEKTIYFQKKKGKQYLKFLEEKKNFKKCWIPPWKK